jgi:hypothetical protein
MDCAVTARQIRRSLPFFRTSSIAQPAKYTLRILHPSLSTWLTAIVLSVVAGAEAQTQKASACGIIYLLKANRADSPSPDLAKEPCWTNPYVQGVLLRTHWNKIQPREEAIDWSFFDQGVALSAKYNKKLGLLITAGVTTPEWIYTAGARRFTLKKLGGPKSFPLQQSLPLPWDPVFQAKWSNVIRAFGARYDNNPQVAYVVMGGPGRRAESFFVTSTADQAALDTLAQSQGYANGLAAWLEGTKWVIDQYAHHFPTVPFILDLGPPYPTTIGRATLQAACDYGATTYRGRFGVKSDGLAPNGPPSGSTGATEVPALSPFSTVGYQFSLPQHGNTVSMAASLNRGINFGAHFIEVYAGDCNDATQAQNLTQAADKLKKIVRQADASREKR